MSRFKQGGAAGGTGADTSVIGTGRKGVAAWFGRLKERFGLQTIIIVLLFLVLYGVLAFYESALLRRIDSLSLFLFDDLYFEEMTSVPAGFLSYVGCFLVQFFRYPVLGAAIYVSLLFAVYCLTRRVFGISRDYAFVALLPVFALLASNTQLGYWIFYLKLPGYYYMAVVAVILSLLSMWVFRKLGNVWRMPYLLVWTLVGYPVMGVYALASTLVMAVMWLATALREKDSRVFAASAVAVACLLVYFVPRYFYYYYYNTVDLDLVYYMGVPAQEWWLGAIKEADYGVHTFWYSMDVYKIPLMVLLFSFVALALSLGLRGFKWSKARYMWLSSYAVLVVCVLFAVRYWYNNEGFRCENRQNAAMWEGDWKGVLECAKEVEKPTRMVVLNKNIALARLGMKNNGVFGASDNCTDPEAPMALKMQYIGGYDTYYYYGRMNYCYRWCMENSVEYGWKPEYLKNAVRSMMASGEYRLAKRYIRVLKRTMFHDSWAERMELLLDSPDKIAQDPDFEMPMQFGSFDDRLTTDESIEEFLMSNVNAVARAEELGVDMFEAITKGDADGFRLLASERRELSPELWDVSMMMPLVKKDKARFFRYVDAYLNEFDFVNNQSARLPKSCREAMHLFANLDKGRTLQITPEHLTRLAGDDAAFAGIVNKAKGLEKRLREMYPDITKKRLDAICAEHLKAQYGNSYYYYFLYVTGIKTY